MIESRCGIKCSECEYKESMNCKGCIAVKKPFWGVCEVKKCCEERKLENCGYCLDFPCGTLQKFAYDKEQGDKGLRLCQCSEWCK